jgi:hypothetical protein
LASVGPGRPGLPRVKAGGMPDDTIASTYPLPNPGPHLAPWYPNPTTNWRIGRPSTSARPPQHPHLCLGSFAHPWAGSGHQNLHPDSLSCIMPIHASFLLSRIYPRIPNELSTHGPRALYGQSPSNLPHETATTENPRETRLSHVLSKTPHYQCPQPQQ